MKNSYTVGNLVYDASIYDGMNTNMDDLPFYKRWLSKNKNARILELCCGSGRLTLPLAKDGHNITGIDYTVSMLAKAKTKASNASLDIEFIEADMRTFELSEQYDLIFIPFNSVHHLYTNEDLFQTLKAVKKHLKKDGIFIFDCFNPNMPFMVAGGKELKEIAQYTTDDGRKVMIKEIMHYESHTQINRIAWHFFINDTFDSIQNVDMRMFFPQELDAYLQWNGFNILHKFGSFDEEVFTNTSDKQIFVCSANAII